MLRSRSAFTIVAFVSLVAFSSIEVRGDFVVQDLYTLMQPPAPAAPATPGQYFSVAPGPNGVQVAATAGNGWLYNGNGTPIPLGDPPYSNPAPIMATNGTQQFGYDGSPQHAVLWSGSTASVVDMNPTNLPGFSSSTGYGMGGNQLVGWGTGTATGGYWYHALLWTSHDPGSAVDLQPTNISAYAYSQAYGTDGTHQVGYAGFEGPGFYQNGNFVQNAFDHAMLWSGSANTAVDLNPAQLSVENSYALAVGGNQQVGYGLVIPVKDGDYTKSHALLWTGTAQSAVDLDNPAVSGLPLSAADATNGQEQVGYSYDNRDPNNLVSGMGTAMLWSGSADSAVNLGTLLPSSFVASQAYNIDASGDVYGIALDSAGNLHAVEWAVPEPASLGLLACAAAATVIRRRPTTRPRVGVE